MSGSSIEVHGCGFISFRIAPAPVPLRSRSLELKPKAHLVNLTIDYTHVSEDERIKTVMITDPDGNHIAFAEAIDLSLAH
jgi:hypothetical protein